ncbi:MAG: hypothetical protein RSE32_03825 [Comamonas sp.]|uniref:hypothetical protein n=1 Tax=Comamonas sp. TaxID=34028 RepID=UPI002FC5B206
MRARTFNTNPLLQRSTVFVQGANSNARLISESNADSKNPYVLLAYLVFTRDITQGFLPRKSLKPLLAHLKSKKGPDGPFGEKQQRAQATQP